tara:strand:+ start:1846 stop:2283 length:438 start_codon:yes stop_codon:yes gene_type:complete
MIRVNGMPQIGSIDIGDMFLEGKQDCCTEYKYYMILEKKYINKIYENLKDVVKEIQGFVGYKGSHYVVERRVDKIIRSVQKDFDLNDLKKLTEKELSLIQFIKKANAIRTKKIKVKEKNNLHLNEIRKRNLKQSSEGVRNISKNK